MLFVHALLLAGTATAAVIPRAAQATVLGDLQTIDSDTKALDSAEKAYTGGLFGAVPIQNAESQLDSDIKSATTDANNNGPVSESDASAAIAYVSNTLEPDVSTAISDLIAKKSQIQAAGLTSTVQKDLASLQSDTQAYGQALTSIAPADQQSAASAALSKVNADLQRGVDAYSS